MYLRRRFLLSSLLFLALLSGFPAWLTWRAIRRVKLERALITAIKKGNAPAVKTLLQQGADADARDEPQRPVSLSTLFSTLLHRHTETYHAPTALMLATVTGQADLVKLLLKHGADSNAGNDSFFVLTVPGTLPQASRSDPSSRFVGRPPRSRAIRFPVHTSVWHTGIHETPLLAAAATGRADIITTLLDNDADLHARDWRGNTILMNAVAFGNANVGTVKMLLDRGADLNAKNQQGNTALYYAKHFEHRDLTALLIRAGASE